MKTRYLKEFEQYSSGQMSPEAKAVFEVRLKQDNEFQRLYGEYTNMIQALHDSETLELRMKLREIMKDQANYRDKTRNRDNREFLKQNNNWLWLAALLVVLIGFSVVVGMMITGADRGDMVASELHPFDIPKNSPLERELLKFEKRNVDFKILSPKDYVFLNRRHPLKFAWSVNSDEPLILDLINWDGKIVYTSGKPVNSPCYIQKRLPPGVLVYRFRTDKESFYIGFLYLQ